MHGNFNEQIFPMLVFTLVGGVNYPFWVTLLTWTYIFGRVLYSFGYLKHPKSRGPGVIFINFSALPLMGFALVSACKMLPGS